MTRSMPIFRVIWLIGQLPQAPVSLTLTMPSGLTSTSSTLPPSAWSAGLTLLIAASTFSFMLPPYGFLPGYLRLLIRHYPDNTDGTTVCICCAGITCGYDFFDALLLDELAD